MDGGYSVVQGPQIIQLLNLVTPLQWTLALYSGMPGGAP